MSLTEDTVEKETLWALFNRFDGFGLADWGDGLIFCFSDSSLTGFEFIVFQYETCWCLQSDLVAFRGL